MIEQNETQYIDANLGLKKCVNASPERNATLLCSEVDYAYQYAELPTPRQLFRHIKDCQANCIIRE